MLTNHHVGADTLYKISTPENNYYRDGFYARTNEEEIQAPDLELNQLISLEDVTQKVQAAVTADMSPGGGGRGSSSRDGPDRKRIARSNGAAK